MQKSLPVSILFGVTAALAACGDGDKYTSLLPADYATTYTEVRGCRRSGDHDLNYIRVLADAQATPAYMSRTSAFPVGSVVVKEEHDPSDTDCSQPVILWTVMSKLASGTAPTTLDWRWQKIGPDKKVTTQDELRCYSCHTGCGVPPDGYDGTCAVP